MYMYDEQGQTWLKCGRVFCSASGEQDISCCLLPVRSGHLNLFQPSLVTAHASSKQLDSSQFHPGDQVNIESGRYKIVVSMVSIKHRNCPKRTMTRQKHQSASGEITYFLSVVWDSEILFLLKTVLLYEGRMQTHLF